MNIKLDSKELSKAMEKIAAIIPSPQQQNAIVFQGTNEKKVILQVVREGISARLFLNCIETNANEDDYLIIDGLLFNAYVKQLADIGEIEIENDFDKDKINITYKKGKLNINQLAEKCYIAYPTYQDKQQIMQVAGGTFQKLIDKTSYVINKTEKRTIIKSLKFESTMVMKSLSAMGTDGFRLAYGKCDIISGEDVSFIVLSSLIDYVSKCVDTEEEVTFSITGNSLIVETTQIQIIIGLTNGDYPNLERIIHANYTEKIVFECDKDNIIQALKRVGVLANSTETKAIKLVGKQEEFLGSILQISSTTEKGNNIEDIVIKVKEGDITTLKIAANSNFFLQALEKASDTIVFTLEPNKPIKIVNANDYDENYVAVILPIKVTN